MDVYGSGVYLNRMQVPQDRGPAAIDRSTENLAPSQASVRLLNNVLGIVRWGGAWPSDVGDGAWPSDVGD